jgi:hypothetical protein
MEEEDRNSAIKIMAIVMMMAMMNMMVTFGEEYETECYHADN